MYLTALRLLVGCPQSTETDDTKPDPDDSTSETGTDLPITLPLPEAIPSTLVPTVFAVRVTTPSVMSTWLEVTGAGGTWTTPPDATVTVHDHRLLGLKAGQTYDVRVLADDGGETVASAPIQVVTPPAPIDMPVFDVTSFDPTLTNRDRFFVMTYLLHSAAGYAVIFDQDGDPVWWLAPEPVTSTFGALRTSLDGKAIVIADFNGVDTSGTGRILRVSPGAMSIAEELVTVIGAAHHDIVELPGNVYGYLTHEYEPLPWTGYGTVPAQIGVLWEIPEGATNPDTQARMIYDPLVSYPETPDYACIHMTPIPQVGAADWDHTNSLLYDDADDSYVVNMRNLDQMLKIDRATGAIVWRMGGRLNQFTIDDPANWWDHGHFSQWGGTFFSMFSNELHHGASRVMVYDVDEAARSITTRFSVSERAGEQVPVLGDVDVLPNGNVLASWAGSGHIEEYRPDGTIAWAVEVSDEANPPRLWYMSDLYDLRAQ